MLVWEAIFCRAVSYHQIPLSTQAVSPELANWWLLSYEHAWDLSTHTLHAFLHPGALSLQQCSGFRLSSAPTEMRKFHPPVLKTLLFEGCIYYKMAQLWKYGVHNIFFHWSFLFLRVLHTIIVFLIFQLKQVQFFSCQFRAEAQPQTQHWKAGVLLFTLVTLLTWK